MTDNRIDRQQPRPAAQEPDSPAPRSEDLTRLVAENVDDFAIFVIDLEGNNASWNPGVEKLLGYAESEFIGRAACDIFTPEDNARDACGRELRTAKEHGRAEDQRWHVRKDGTRFWANGLMMTLKDDAGTLRGYTKIMRDDTARKHAEEERERFFSIGTDLLVIAGFDGQFKWISPAWERAFGWTLAELTAHPWLYFTHPDDHERTIREAERLIGGGEETVSFENRYRCKDGVYRWLSWRAKPYPQEELLYASATDITERKRSEERLRRSEERYRTLFASIDEGFCVIEMIFDERDEAIDYRFMEINPAFELLTGINTEAALSGRTMSELVPGIETHWAETYGRVAVTGEPTRFVDGSEAMNRWFDVYAFRTGQPEERKVAVLFNNITERKRSEAALREREEQIKDQFAQLETIYATTPVGLSFVDASLRFVRINERLAEINGLPAHEHIGRELREVLPQLADELEVLYRRVFDSGEPVVDLELRGTTPACPDVPRDWLLSYYPVRDDGGAVAGVHAVVLDITTRKAAEEERERLLRSLEVERERLTTIFMKAPAFVATLRGPDYIFELTNPAYLRLVGRRDFIGKKIREALPEIEGQGYFELLDRVYETGEPYEGRELSAYIQREPNGAPEERFVNLLFQPLFDANAQVSGIFIHGVDITDQVRARREAEEANRIKDEFLATLSHELRTPLTSILGWSSMLRGGQLDAATAARALETIERNARAQVQLIDDLLDIGRIITGKLRMDVQRVELASVIEAAADAVRPAAEAKSIRLQVLLDSAAGAVSGDADRLQQVVWNLLTNGVKFTPKGGRVQVRLERINSHVEISVTDTGRGIRAEFLPHVFDRFRQADQTSTRAHGGLGLGLSIVRHLVELHGGTVSVDSAGENQGATFTIALPSLIMRHEAGTAERVHPAANRDFGGTLKFGCPPPLDDLRVLVVDDDPDTRDLLRAVLERCGSRVTTAASASEALTMLAAEMPEILVSDIGMPEEDGYTLIGKMRALEKLRGTTRIPAIALTAYARVEDRVRTLQAGFHAHVSKPIEPVELVAVVASLAGRNGE